MNACFLQGIALAKGRGVGYCVLMDQHKDENQKSKNAVIRQSLCIGCGACMAKCRFDAIRKFEFSPDASSFLINSENCNGCGVCIETCSVRAIDLIDSILPNPYSNESDD